MNIFLQLTLLLMIFPTRRSGQLRKETTSTDERRSVSIVDGSDHERKPSKSTASDSIPRRSFGSQPVEYHMKKKTYKNAAVATNSDFSADLAIEVLKNGGSAADSAIVALLAEGVANPQSMGLGGGFILTYFDGKTKQIECLNARECAPGLASEHMFSSDEYEVGATVAVPGEIKGYWELHKKYGVQEWKELFSPIIKACREGIPVSPYTAGIFKLMKRTIKSSSTLKQLFIDPNTGDTFEAGSKMKRPKLADTLEIIAKDGQSALYKGKLTNNFVQDIRNKGGIITTQDMEEYRAKWVPPAQLTLIDNLTIYSPSIPGGGLILSLILDVISKLPRKRDEIQEWFNIVETWKYAYGYRFSFEGPKINFTNETLPVYDQYMSQFVLEQVTNARRTSDNVKHYTDKYGSTYYGGGTCHICIYAPDGSAVSVTSSINCAFGALFASPSTGIILNNHMMDFNTLDYTADIKPTNRISGFKQPISSMTPTIILDVTKKPCLIIGAAGGTKIITAVSQVIYDYLIKGVPLHKAMCRKRMHHSLIPMKLRYEDGVPENIIEGLIALGHTVKVIMVDAAAESEMSVPASSSVTAIGVEHYSLHPYGDPRRSGAVQGW